MCGISSYAEFPERVRFSFVNTTRNHCGIYGIIMYLNGVAQLMIIDDFFIHND
jgi:hypothetical protein